MEMDRKVLVCLQVPSIGRTFEVFIPDHLRVKSMIPLLVKAVTDQSGGEYVSSGHEFLCSVGQNALFDEDARLADYGIHNGDHLLLL